MEIWEIHCLKVVPYTGVEPVTAGFRDRRSAIELLGPELMTNNCCNKVNYFFLASSSWLTFWAMSSSQGNAYSGTLLRSRLIPRPVAAR